MERAVLLGGLHVSGRLVTARFSAVPSAGFQALLRALDPDPHQAAARYHALRRKLVWFFERRGSRTPEDHADETLTRVAHKLDQTASIDDPDTYALGVARFVRLESLRATTEVPFASDTPEPAAPRDAHDPEASRRLGCMERCLSRVPADQRELILAYYTGDQRRRIDARKTLAAGLGIPVSALRIRAFRIRERLHACVSDCLRRVSAMDASLVSVPDMNSAPADRPEETPRV